MCPASTHARKIFARCCAYPTSPKTFTMAPPNGVNGVHDDVDDIDYSDIEAKSVSANFSIPP